MKKIYHILFFKLKNKLQLKIAWIVILICVQSCDLSNNMDYKIFDMIREDKGKMSNNFTGNILIIPNEGCHPCIGKALKFAKENLNNKSIYFIITTDFDFKRTKLNFSSSEILSQNLIFDEKQICKTIELRQNYLISLSFKDGKLIYKKAITPEEASIELSNIQQNLFLINRSINK